MNDLTISAKPVNIKGENYVIISSLLDGNFLARRESDTFPCQTYVIQADVEQVKQAVIDKALEVGVTEVETPKPDPSLITRPLL